MNRDPGPDEGRSMSLAFDLDALQALAYPWAVFADARGWSRYVGAVADDADAVDAFVRRYGLRQDYAIGDLDRQSVLSKLKWEADTNRYVFVGTDSDDRALADYVGWEYLDVETAARKADWTLAADVGPLGRVRARFVRVARRFFRSR